LTEETEAAGLTGLAIRHPLRAEQARSGSIDITRAVGSRNIEPPSTRDKHKTARLPQA
jgi:hypothetical protein